MSKFQKDNNFAGELSAFLSSFDPYLEKYFKNKISTSYKYSPVIKKFYEELFIFSLGGKKLRAFLIFLGYKIGGGADVEKILPICLSAEIFHNFFLIHDDVIDKSDLRRGKATIHRVFEKKYDAHSGESMAILLGDIACICAYELVNKSEFVSDLKIICQKELSKVLLETTYGEILDIENSYKKPTMEEIWQVTDLKTARYSFVGPLIIGAILGGAKKSQIEAIEKFGLGVGMAFQLHDDILGVFGDEKVTGKSVLSDLCEGKNTVLIKKAKELASLKDERVLEVVWGKKTARIDDLKKVREIIENSGALSWCKKDEEKLIKKAKSYIKEISKNPNFENILYELCDFIIKRES